MVADSFAHGFICNIPQLSGSFDLTYISIGIERAVCIGYNTGPFKESALLIAVRQNEHGLLLLGEIPEGLMVKGSDLCIVGPDMGLRINNDGLALLHSGFYAV